MSGGACHSPAPGSPLRRPSRRRDQIPATLTTDIDSPRLRGRRCLNRRVNLILPRSPSTDVNKWKFTGNRCGNGVGIWELDRVSLRSMASGGGSPVRGPYSRDIRCQTRTPPQEPASRSPMPQNVRQPFSTSSGTPPHASACHGVPEAHRPTVSTRHLLPRASRGGYSTGTYAPRGKVG